MDEIRRICHNSTAPDLHRLDPLRGNIGHLHPVAAHLQRALASLQDLKNSYAIFPWSPRSLPPHDAIDEVLALHLQRLQRGKWNRLSFGLLHLETAVRPSYFFVVYHQLVRRAAIFKHHHLFAANYNQPLLFIGVQPAYEDMSPGPMVEKEVGNRDV